MRKQTMKSYCLAFVVGDEPFKNEVLSIICKYHDNKDYLHEAKLKLLNLNQKLMLNGADRPEKIEYLRSQVNLIVHIALEISDGIEASEKDFEEEFNHVISTICELDSNTSINLIDKFIDSCGGKDPRGFNIACEGSEFLIDLRSRVLAFYNLHI